MNDRTGSGKIAVFFPGIGYNPYMPLLYYARKILSALGYECRTVTYTLPEGLSLRGRPEKTGEVFESLLPQAEAGLEDIDWTAYDDIVFASKSIGTAIASAYAKNRGLKPRHVLYTPLAYTFRFEPENAVAFIGTNDPYSRLDDIFAPANEQRIPLHVYDGANHSLETGDVAHDMETLREVMHITEEFLSRNIGETAATRSSEPGLNTATAGQSAAAAEKSAGAVRPGQGTSAAAAEQSAGAVRTGQGTSAAAAEKSEAAASRTALWGKTDSGDIRIDPAKILYLESVDDKVFVCTLEAVARIDGTLASFVTEADDESFFRCSKSMVINVNRVNSLKSLSSNRIDATMEGGEHIIISRRYASEFRRLLKGGRR